MLALTLGRPERTGAGYSVASSHNSSVGPIGVGLGAAAFQGPLCACGQVVGTTVFLRTTPGLEGNLFKVTSEKARLQPHCCCPGLAAGLGKAHPLSSLSFPMSIRGVTLVCLQGRVGWRRSSQPFSYLVQCVALGQGHPPYRGYRCARKMHCSSFPWPFKEDVLSLSYR